MFEQLDGYLSVISVNARQQLVYKLDFVVSFLFRTATALIMILVWTAIYTNTGVSIISNFTLPMIYGYFFIVSMLWGTVISSSEDVDFQSDVQSGTITFALIRPVSYPINLFLASFGENAIWAVVVGIPLIVIASLFVPFALTMPTFILLVIEVLLGYMIINLIAFLFGTLSLYVVNIWGIISVGWTAISLLSGVLIPLTFFPSYASQIIFMLPFQLFAFMPAATILGTATHAMIINSIIVGVIWFVVLFAVATLWWQHVKKRISSVGG